MPLPGPLECSSGYCGLGVLATLSLDTSSFPGRKWKTEVRGSVS